MPLSRYRIKNEYGLADPELYRAADKDDPEALLEGVAMAGLVGLLRQLGDLAEFAAEIFHDLHEEVMATASRGHSLLVRVQQLEAEFPSIEMRLLSQTSHSSLLYNSGSEWHPNLQMEQNLITQGDLPRFVMDSYEECRGPPRLFILDKFDVAGAGACLKRYTDPSHIKFDGLENTETHGEKKRKAKKKGSQAKNGDNTPQALPKVHTRLHDLLHEETVENVINGPASRVKLKRRLDENKLEQSYMEKFLKINSAELDAVHKISVNSAHLLPCNGSPREELSPIRSSNSSSSDIDDSLAKPPVDQLTKETKYELSGVKRQFSSESYETFSPIHNDVDEKEIEVDRERKMESTTGDHQSDDIASDVDYYMDALAIVDSPIEADLECISKNDIHSSKKQPDNDADQVDLPDSKPVESFILTDNESISSSGQLSELSYTDNSNLTKAVPSDDSVSAEAIESDDSSRVKDDHLLSEHPLVDENDTAHPSENVCNDVCDTEVDTSTYSYGTGEERSSSSHTDTHPVSLSLDLTGSLKEDAFENLDSNEVCSTNNESREYPPDDLVHDSKISCIPSDAVSTLLHVPYAEKHLDYQDKVGNSCVLRKLLESENNKDVDLTENASKEEPHTSDTEPVASDVPNFVDTIAAEPVKYCFDNHVDPSHLDVFCVDEQPELCVALKQPEFSVLLEEEHPGLVLSHEQDQYSVLSADEQSPLPPLHTEEHNQLVVSHKEEQTLLVVSEIQKPLADERSQRTSSMEEEQPQLSPSHVAEQPQLASSYKEEQIQLITSQTEDRPLSIASCAELQSQSLALTDPCTVVLREHDGVVILEAVSSSKPSQSIHCLTNDSEEPILSDCTEVISPVELGLPSLEKDRDSEADCRENDFFIDWTASVQHNSHLDTLNSEEASKEFVPLSDEGNETNTLNSEEASKEFVPLSDEGKETNTLNSEEASKEFVPLSDEVTEINQSKVTSEVSAACLMDDIYLSENTDLSVVEELTSIVGSLHPDVEMEHSLKPLQKALPPEMSQQAGTTTGLETVLCNPVSNMESNPGMPADIHEITRRSEMITLEQSVLDSDTPSACNSQMETPIEHKVLQIVEQFQMELKPAEKVSPEAYIHEKQSTTPDCLYPDEQPSALPKFAELSMSEFSKPSHSGYVDSQPIKQSLPMPTFPIKAEESLNCLDQEDHYIASGPSVHSLSCLPPSNANAEVSIPPIALFSRFDFRGPSENMFDEMPPLPPLPPFQWRIPKVIQHAPEALERNIGQFDLSQLTTSQSTCNLTPQLDHEIKEGENTRMQFPTLSAIKDEVSTHDNNLSQVSTAVSNEKLEDFLIPDGAQSSIAPPITDDDRLHLPHNDEDTSSTSGSKTLQEKSAEAVGGLASETEKSLALSNTMEEVDPCNIDDGKPQLGSSYSDVHSMFAPHPELAYVKSNGGFQRKLPRPRNPLIDAVVALDKTKLRKVTERIRPPSGQKVDERDAFLEQIRTKSFNLKPTAATRPSIQGPKTNLRVAAILEKANSIRQALAGSDDDDEDNWSDS